MANIKFSVIGTGHLGSIHLKLLKQNENADVVGIFDPNTEKATELANEHNITAFATLEDAINSSDALIIAAPTIHHYEIANKCLEAGKHIFIEKPITHTHTEGLKLCEKARDNKVKLQVGHVERFNPALAALSTYELNPMFIEAHRLAQFKTRATDVSVIHDLMIHDIDIVLHLIGSSVTAIDANGVSVITDTADICNARLTFENGAVANLTASRISARPMRKMRFFQKDNYISCDFGKPEVEVFEIIDGDLPKTENIVPATMLGSIEAGQKNRNIYFKKPVIPEINAIAEEHNSFINAIENDEDVSVTGYEATEALRIAEKISEIIAK